MHIRGLGTISQRDQHRDMQVFYKRRSWRSCRGVAKSSTCFDGGKGGILASAEW